MGLIYEGFSVFGSVAIAAPPFPVEVIVVVVFVLVGG